MLDNLTDEDILTFSPADIADLRRLKTVVALFSVNPRDLRETKSYPPIKTVGAPGGIIAPPDAVKSPILAAGMPPIITVADPITIASTPHESVILAAGSPPINTVGAPGGKMGVGIPIVAVLTIMSVTRAAGIIFNV